MSPSHRLPLRYLSVAKYHTQMQKKSLHHYLIYAHISHALLAPTAYFALAAYNFLVTARNAAGGPPIAPKGALFLDIVLLMAIPIMALFVIGL